MLYDKKWDKQIETRRKVRGWLSRMLWPLSAAEVFSMTDFISFAAAQPQDEPYRYTDPTGCALAQYLQSRGVSAYQGMLSPKQIDALHPDLNDCLTTGGHSRDRTFGALAARLREAA